MQVAMIRRLIQRFDSLVALHRAEESVASHFRAEQLREILRLSPVTMAANIVNATIVLIAFQQHAQPWLLWSWYVAVLAASTYALLRYRQLRSVTVTRVSQQGVRRVVYNAAAFGVLWGLLPALMSQHPETHTIISVLCAGMLCAGAYVLCAIPAASLAYMVTMAIGCVLGMLSTQPFEFWSILCLSLVYVLVLVAGVVATGRSFAGRQVAEIEAQRQRDIVDLLLKDFESDSRDWLWEMDAQGQLSRVPDRLARAFGLTSEQLAHQTFVTLLRPLVHRSDDDDPEPVDPMDRLQEAIHDGQAFRDLVIPVRLNSRRHWWQISGRPVRDEQGQLMGWRGVCSDVTAARRAEQKLQFLARNDVLTGLANRYHFRDRLAEVLESSDRQMATSALLFLDLDNFKAINDSLGHAAGDRVLKVVAGRLQFLSAAGVTLARLGGDEFAMLIRGASPRQAERTADEVIGRLNEPCRVDGAELQIGCSVGIAMMPQHASDPDELLRLADLALFAAKAAGRGSFRMFSREIEEQAQRRHRIQRDLRVAMLREEFELFFQPQTDARTEHVAGFEALLRWRHDVLGMINPDEFIPLAEEAGLIVPIGRWVLEQACREACKWDGGVRVAVNVSAQQFQRSNVVADVSAALSQTGLSGSSLELEITESLLVTEGARLEEQFAQLRAMGVRIALDDFGTGYSSLAYLRQFSLDRLKIDRAFVKQLVDDPTARAVIQAIVQLAQAMSLETTAEGVETRQQLQILRGIGCDELQGWLFSPAISADQIAKYLSVHGIVAPIALPGRQGCGGPAA